jgi:hypothetical protein
MNKPRAHVLSPTLHIVYEGFVDAQDVTEDYRTFLAHTAQRIKELRRERGLSLQDMVVVHGFYDFNWRRMEREGVGSVQSLLRIAKAFGAPLTTLTASFGDHSRHPH